MNRPYQRTSPQKRKRRGDFHLLGANSLLTFPGETTAIRAAFRNRAHRIVAPVDQNRAAAAVSHIECLVSHTRVTFYRPGDVNAVVPACVIPGKSTKNGAVSL